MPKVQGQKQGWQQHVPQMRIQGAEAKAKRGKGQEVSSEYL
jgi:hypothetical protein